VLLTRRSDTIPKHKSGKARERLACDCRADAGRRAGGRVAEGGRSVGEFSGIFHPYMGQALDMGSSAPPANWRIYSCWGRAAGRPETLDIGHL
jgi:hypothetical protein